MAVAGTIAEEIREWRHIVSRIEDEVCRKLNDTYGHLRWADRATRVIEKRAVKGLSEHGQTMERDDLSESDWLEHAEHEMMDANIYLEKLIDITTDPASKWYLEELQRSQLHVLYMFESRFAAVLVAANK